MTDAYIVGHITVQDPASWAEYRSKVPGTLTPWGGELVFRGQQRAVLAGDNPHTDIVVIRFPCMTALNNWFASPEYQALIPLRQQAAQVDLLAYET